MRDSTYNATGYWTEPGSTGPGSVVALQVNAEGQILRAAGTSCAPGEGTPAFDAHYRAHSMSAMLGLVLRVELDGAKGYRNALSRLLLPASYRRGC